MVRLLCHALLRICLCAVILLPVAGGGNRPVQAADWSRSEPRINLTHIFEGEINKRGKPVGFHARPGGKDPGNARLVKILEGPNQQGVYVAVVTIRRSFTGSWREKRSSFFPDRMDRKAVVRAILHAYANRSTGKSVKFRGPSGLGFTIEGWLLDNGAINTAYPIFK